MIDESWNDVTEEEWDELAQIWMSELRGDSSATITAMNFSASPALQWQFILKAAKYAESDDELFTIAAGPVEHLLGTHGTDFIDQVEKLAERDAKFSRLLTGVWKHTMTDEVWNRLHAIVEKVEAGDDAEQEASPYLQEHHEALFKNGLGSVMHLLGEQQQDFLALIEKRAAENSGFARLLSETAKKSMDNVAWIRLQAIATKYAPRRT